jgi:broad specificity phosphatase PhoE
MLKDIILVRHGQSQKDKSNPQRKLTSTGAKQILNTSKEIYNLFPSVKVSLEIFTSNTTRTIMSANILANYFKIGEVKTSANIRVKNIDLLETVTDEDITVKYFSLFENNQLSKTITPPPIVAARFLKVVTKINESTENIIIVGHGTALEAFAYYQDIFIPAIHFSKELGYGDWLWLKRKVIN